MKRFEILIWKEYESPQCLGSPVTEVSFENHREARLYFNRAGKHFCKMLMYYDNESPDANGTTLEEEWADDNTRDEDYSDEEHNDE